MLEVVRDRIAHEGFHCHGVVTEHADGARRRSRRFGRHDGADEHAVVPIPRLIHERSRGRSSAAEHDGGEGHARLGAELGGDAGAVLRGSGEAGVGVGGGVFAVRVHGRRPGFARPVIQEFGRVLRELFPPHGVVRGVVRHVGEDGALLGGSERIEVGVLVGAGRDAEETVFGVRRPQPAVFADADPRDVVADGRDLITLLSVFFGGNEHGEVGLTAGGGERRRDVLGFLVLGALAAEDEHVLRHPALVLAEVGGDAQREALFAEQHVAAVSGVHGDDGIVLGEVHDVSLFGVDVAGAVEALDEIAVRAELVEAHLAHAGHDHHVQNDVDGVGDFDADLRERRTDDAHGVGNDVHGLALHLALGDAVSEVIRLFGIHPLDDGMGHGVLFVAAADERSVLHAGNVVGFGAVQVAVGEFFLVEPDELAGADGLFLERRSLLFAAVDPDDLIGRGDRRALFDELKHLLVVGQSSHDLYVSL